MSVSLPYGTSPASTCIHRGPLSTVVGQTFLVWTVGRLGSGDVLVKMTAQ